MRASFEEQCPEDKILVFFKRLLREWKQELERRPEAEDAPCAGRRTWLLSNSARYLDPMFKMCRRKVRPNPQPRAHRAHTGAKEPLLARHGAHVPPPGINPLSLLPSSEEARCARASSPAGGPHPGVCVFVCGAPPWLGVQQLYDDIRDALLYMVNKCRERDYLAASGQVHQAGHWQRPVAHRGDHGGYPRAVGSREKIHTKSVAHIMNDETTRKYLQSVKRLMTFCQRRYPALPSKASSSTPWPTGATVRRAPAGGGAEGGRGSQQALLRLEASKALEGRGPAD